MNAALLIKSLCARLRAILPPRRVGQLTALTMRTVVLAAGVALALAWFALAALASVWGGRMTARLGVVVLVLLAAAGGAVVTITKRDGT